MNASMALVPVSTRPTNGLAGRRQALRQRSLDAAAVVHAASRYAIEPLEPRRLLSGGFGDHGFAHVDFPNAAGTWSQTTCVAAAPDGSVYVGGELLDGSNEMALAKFNPDGTPDASFGTDGSGTVTVPTDDVTVVDRILFQADGKLLVTGETPDGLAVVRLNADGSVDTAFGGGARVYDVFNGFYPEALTNEDGAWFTDGGEVTLVAMKGPDVVTLRLTGNGHPDTTYAPGGYTTSVVDADGDPLACDNLLAAKPTGDGGIVAYAVLWSEDVTQRVVQLRLDATGQVISQKPVDPGLALGNEISGGYSYDPVVMFNADGSAFLTGGANDPRVAKLTADGVLDDNFGSGGLATLHGYYAQLLAVTPTGGALVEAGRYDSYVFGAPDPVVQIDASGAVDPAFNGGQSTGAGAYPATVMSDGSVILTYGGGGYSDSGEPLTPSFVVEKLPPDETFDDTQTTDPAALEVLARGRAANDANATGMFVDPVDGSVWNPEGDVSVYDA